MPSGDKSNMKKSRSGPTIPEHERKQPVQRKARFTVEEAVEVDAWIAKHDSFRHAVLVAAGKAGKRK